MHEGLPDPRSAGSDVEEIGHRGNVCLIEAPLPGGGRQLVLMHQLTGEQVSVEGARLHHTDRFAYLEHGGKTEWCSSLLKWSAWRVKATSAEFMFCPWADGWDARWLEDRKLDYRDKLELASFLEGGTELHLSIYDVRNLIPCSNDDSIDAKPRIIRHLDDARPGRPGCRSDIDQTLQHFDLRNGTVSVVQGAGLEDEPTYI